MSCHSDRATGWCGILFTVGLLSATQVLAAGQSGPQRSSSEESALDSRPGSAPGAQPAWQFQSRAAHVQLLELFTSQGCSSCPPAESWLSNWAQDERLWQQIVPVAFHVDYWDRLGWPDPFSDAANTRRQRRYASVWGRPTVYTPGFVIDGQEWRGWFDNEPVPSATDDGGVLQLTWDGRMAQLTYDPIPATRRPTTATVALLRMGQHTQIAAGENVGREMVGDFVVVGWSEVGLHKADGTWHGRVSVDIHTTGDASDGARVMPREADQTMAPPARAIAAWITARPQGQVLQATGGWLRAGAP